MNWALVLGYATGTLTLLHDNMIFTNESVRIAEIMLIFNFD